MNKIKQHYNCVYMFISPSNKKYIGQTVNFKERYATHKCASTNKTIRQDKNTPFHRAINKYGIENFEIIILKENLKTQCLMNFWEMYYIDKYNTLSKFNEGYNLADGGHYTNPYAGKTEEEIKEIGKKRSKTLKEKYKNGDLTPPMKGKTISEEGKRKISENSKKMHAREDYICPLFNLSDEAKQKLKDRRKERTGTKAPNCKKVIQYSRDGKYIKTWNYIKEASEALGINKDSISHCCNGRHETAGGFIWKRYDDVYKDDS